MRFCLLALLLALPHLARTQFVDDFEDGDVEGWQFFTGDGEATMDFVPRDGHARIVVDATQDRHNVWWAIIKRPVSPALDLSRLADPNVELRIEARVRVRVSAAPRRLNFMVNTQRTTDFHEHLKEYDLADTTGWHTLSMTGWHTLSMTTRGLDAMPGDTLYAQLGVTDWGSGRHHVDVAPTAPTWWT